MLDETQTAFSILDEAAAALGGWSALQSIGRVHLESEGQDWEPWQAYDIGGTVDVSTFRNVTDLDLSVGASSVEMDAAVVYPWPHRVAYIEITDSQAGMLADLNLGAVAIRRLHPSLYATARRDFAAFAPEALRLARADADAQLEGGTSKSVRFRHHDAGRQATLTFADDHTPTSLTYDDHDPVQGDIAYRFEWSDWRDVGGIRLPYKLRRLIDGRPIREERLSRVTLNEPVSDEKYRIPAIVRAQDETGRRIVTGWTQRRRAAGLPYEEFTRPQQIDMTPLAFGVWLARGGTHNSLVIEMADHFVIFEPPLFEGRSEGVIAAAKKSAPGKPIRHVVLSHFHDDHMGGVRTYAAEGATVVVHSSAGDYIRAVLGQRRTIEPDRLEIARREGRQSQPAVMLVEDAVTLTDGTREVALFHAPNSHVSGMLVGYVPDARVLFTSDLVSDTFPLIPAFASAVDELIQKNGLSVEMIACGHGNVMPYAQLAYALGKSTRSTDIAEINALEQRLIDGIKAKDVKQIMSCYSDDVFAYDVVPPREYVGAAAFQKPWQGFLDMFKGPINAEVNDLVINSDGKIAYSRSVQRVSGTTNEGKPFDETFRITDVYRKSQGKWVIVQEHISEPPHAARW
jgi:ketosteroid isomerase-like protein